jgi:hypothetical protein
VEERRQTGRQQIRQVKGRPGRARVGLGLGSGWAQVGLGLGSGWARVGLGLGSGFTLRAWAFAGLAWPGGRAWDLACGLSPKTRPARAWAFGLCSKSPSPSPQSGLGTGPAPAARNVKLISKVDTARRRSLN